MFQERGVGVMEETQVCHGPCGCSQSDLTQDKRPTECLSGSDSHDHNAGSMLGLEPGTFLTTAHLILGLGVSCSSSSFGCWNSIEYVSRVAHSKISWTGSVAECRMLAWYSQGSGFNSSAA